LKIAQIQDVDILNRVKLRENEHNGKKMTATRIVKEFAITFTHAFRVLDVIKTEKVAEQIKTV
jgi:hypothetical protein